MSDVAENEGSMDFSKMKVNDLKKLLKSRGLSVAGVKQDLIERLQSSEAAAEALLEGSEVGEDGFDEELDKELDESALMADEEHTDEIPVSNMEKKEQKENSEECKPVEESAPLSPSPKKSEESKETPEIGMEQNGSTEVESQEGSKQAKVSLKPQPMALSEADKKKARAERFGTVQKLQASSMAKRAERFNLNKNSTSKPADSSTSQTKVTSTTTNEVLKRRAERFGILSPAEVKRQHLEKLQARKLRFQQSAVQTAIKGKVTTTSSTTGSSTAPTTTTTTTNGTKISTSLSLEERKRMRAERFKMTT